MREFVITDIHGCRASFQTLLEKIEFGKNDKLFILGDNIDRGPDSKGVIDDLMQLEANGHEVHCLRGNHEEEMLAAYDSYSSAGHWWRWGGKETTASFGFHTLVDLPLIEDKYWNWMGKLPWYIEHENYLMVHAGFNFAAKKPFSDKENMLWIRDWYRDIDYDFLGERIILHGHTPRPEAEIRAQHKNLAENQYLDLDCGCYADKEGMGRLCAYELKSGRLFFQKRLDKVTWSR